MVYAIRYQISFCNYRRDHNQQIKNLCLGAQEKQISLIYSPQTFESHVTVAFVIFESCYDLLL